jgi:hypothetical protein
MLATEEPSPSLPDSDFAVARVTYSQSNRASGSAHIILVAECTARATLYSGVLGGRSWSKRSGRAPPVPSSQLRVSLVIGDRSDPLKVRANDLRANPALRGAEQFVADFFKPYQVKGFADDKKPFYNNGLRAA